MAYIDLKRERSIIELVGGQEVILENLNHSTTEPIFRQNGYEVNGDKKSFALAFDSSNSEYVQINNPLVLSNDGDFFYVKGRLKSIPITTNPFLFTGGTNDQLRLLNNTNLRIFSGSTVYEWAGMYLGDVLDIRFEIANGGTEYIMTSPIKTETKTKLVSHTFTIDEICRNGSIFVDFDLEYLEINNEQFTLTEGLGNEVLGSSGTVGTINTSHADGIQRVNFGQWLKGNSEDGWFPYTV
jgi:sporulation protein YlmC with PRC-barrel domain